jgi:phosphatidate cytidylyltransferase
MSNLAWRVITALIALPLLFWSIWLPTPFLFVGFVILATLFGLIEYFHLAEKLGFIPFVSIGICGLLGVHSLFYVRATEFLPALLGLLLGATMVQGVLTERDFKKSLPSHAATLHGVVYVGVLCGFLIGLKRLEPPELGSRFLTFFFIVIMAGDVAAYFVGRAFGRHKLAPLVSPGKTIEGAVGNVVGSLAAAVAVHYGLFPALPLAHALVLAVVMNIIGQLGDLYESLLKRGAGTKDAAAVLPGHGGLLDRLDSLLFNAPVLYYYAQYGLPPS